jgi:myo-inositol-1(or 4)-monophosphatase
LPVSDAEDDLALLIRAAQAAGEVARSFFRGRFWTRDKGAEGPVTEADFAVNDTLAAILRPARPAYGWLSEETPDDSARLSADRVFILDPIDGTRAFIDGHDGFAHSLAVATAGRITAAVVYLPVQSRLYTATADGPASLNGQPIRCSDRPAPEGATVLAARSTLDPAHWTDGTAPAVTRAFRPSLANRMCLVADGSFDAMLTLRPTWEWDIAAGALIAERAGARVTDRLGRPLAFNTPGAQADGVVAAGDGVWRALVGTLKP